MNSLPFVLTLLSFTLPCAFAAASDPILLNGNNITNEWRGGNCSTTAADNCHVNATCQDGLLGGLTHYHRCVCEAGTTGDGRVDGTGCVVEKRPCTLNSECHVNGMCNRAIGFCVCAPGFFGDGAVVCSDSDIPAVVLVPGNVTGWLNGTCSERHRFCDRLATCENGRLGDRYYFRCFCPNNMFGDGYLNGTGCPLNRTVCAKDSDCHQYGMCNVTDFFCQCKPGFFGDGADSCTDINDCEKNPCDVNAKCVDTQGSFVCTCDFERHYEGNGTFCIHRCDSDFHCHPDAKCNVAIRDCECKSGFLGDGVNCTDIDECTAGPNPCPADSTCVNEQGSYQCLCNNGYTNYNNTQRKCDPLPLDCEDLRVNFSKTVSGLYEIDPDFTGPANNFTVYCLITNDYAVTNAVIRNYTEGEEAAGDHVYDYGTDHVTLQALLQRSYFCYQSTSMECQASFKYGADFMWQDAFNQTHTSFAGSSVDGMCGCGQLKKCEQCNCGHNQKSFDYGSFVDKTKLPIMHMRFGNVGKGKLIVGHLKCGPRVFDIPPDCEYWKLNRTNPNGAYHVDLDGPFGNPPVLVYCDLRTYLHVAVTEMQVQLGNITLSTTQTVAVDYLQHTRDVLMLVTTAQFCVQRVEYVCLNSGITGGRVYVNVSSNSRQLDYFPGANGVADSCGCGATQSCRDPTVRCDCDIEDGTRRRDLGDIINRNDLPVRAVTGGTTTSSNYFLVSHLRCGRYQFGIPPNCERLRTMSKETPYQYTYFIDPDAPLTPINPAPNVAPFLAECRFNANPVYGITVIHHANETWFQMGSFFTLTYLQVTLLQLQALKSRSTYCTQKVDISCHSFSLTFQGESSVWTGLDQKDYVINDTLTSCSTGGGCNCDGTAADGKDSGLLADLLALPIASMNFTDIIGQLASGQSAANISIGPLECTELFPTCAALYQFVEKVKKFGEMLPETESVVTIDPDGAAKVTAFEVTCKWPEDTVISPPDSGTVTTDPANPTEGKSQCFDIEYKDENGNDIITKEQLVALRDRSTNCFQSLKVECQHARVSGMVNFTTCDGKDQIGWAGSVGEDSCQCGVTRHCDGGKDFKCNCDLADGHTRADGAVIIRKDRLPVCRICLTLDGIPPNMSNIIPKRQLKFHLSPLNCHAGSGRHVQSSCQVARLRAHVPKETVEIVYMNPTNPVPVACKFYPNPPQGDLVVFPEHQVYRNVSGNVTIDIHYYTVNLTILHILMLKNVYCTQRVYIFCVPDDTPYYNLTGRDGWYDILGVRHKTWDRMTPQEITDQSVCEDYPDLCQKCPEPVRGYVIYSKQFLPITALSLTVPGKITVVIDSAKCSDLFGNCHEIMESYVQRYSSSSRHAIDPDGPGGVKPLQVKCTFKTRQDCAVSTVQGTNVVTRNGAESARTDPMAYSQISSPQVQALANVSSFCWQPVGFDCKKSPLIHKNDPLKSHYRLQGQTSLSFGTAQDTDFVGCACGVTGTCGGSNSDTCRCDRGANTVLRDEGVVSRKDMLPVTEFVFAAQGASSYTKMNVGDIKCSNKVCKQFPTDCHKALTQRKSFRDNEVDYTKSGEFYINPSPNVCTEPFLVYCEMDLANNIGITKIITKAKKDLEMRPGNKVTVEYYGLTEQQIRCLIDQSAYCIQPVAYHCYEAKLLGGGVQWKGPKNSPQVIWGGGDEGTCACGADKVCGGADTRTQQQQRKCSCDINDSVWRKDAGVLTKISQLPLTYIDLTALTFTSASRVNVTIGDLQCGNQPIPFNECNTAFHDCSEEADCIDTADGYNCKCRKGWEGKTHNRTFNPELPVANGRECPDDNECTFNVCPIGISDCVNTPGSFECICHNGFQKTKPTTCEDIDECKSPSTHNCDQNAKCINQYGTFKCACHRNYRGDGVRGTCHQIGNCVLFGDPHEVTFDKRRMDYQGVPGCPIVAVTDECPGPNGAAPGTGQITILFTPWRKDPQRHGTGEFTWVKDLTVHIKNHVIEMKQDRELVVDDIKQDAFFEDDLTIFDNGRDLVLTWGEIEIYWDGEEVAEIFIPTSFKDRLCGICGNFNGDSSDDMIVGPGCNGTAVGSNQTVVTTDEEYVFGNSWMVPSAQCVATCEPGPPTPVCRISQAKARQECARAFDKTNADLRACLIELGKSGDYLENQERACVFDVCHVEEGTEATVCRYAQMVVEKCFFDTQVTVTNWRKPGFCEIKCEGNRVYKKCDDLKPVTQKYISCPQLRAPGANFTQPINCVPGCQCPPGYLEEKSQGTTTCVKEEDCGCFYNGSYIPVGKTLTSKNCQDSVECKKGGQVTLVPVLCGDHENCSLQGGVVGCHCVDGYIKVGVKCFPDPCVTLICSANAECVQGQCQCKQGYQGDCQSCKDVDECATGQHTCRDHWHEECVNIDGSFTCVCAAGYFRERANALCKDVDECALGEDRCPANSECINDDGGYACSCCMGYVFSKGKCLWEGESNRFFNASGASRGANAVCCDCNTPDCDKNGTVCGTDGETYPSVRALIVQSCKNGKNVKPMYDGKCQSNCSKVQCQQPYAVCEEPESPGGVAKCGCPTCTNIDIRIISLVCASNDIIYRSKCEFEAAMCINNIVAVIIINDTSPCTGQGGPGVPGNGSGWSDCDVNCGFGEVKQTFTIPNGSFALKAVCYKACENQTCENFTCSGTRQCLKTDNGPQCVCQQCGGQPKAPVCGSVGKREVQTYDNQCLLDQEACIYNEKIHLLENNACPREPENCEVMNLYERRKNQQGCENEQPVLFPVCKGGCGKLPTDCCVKKDTTTVDVVYKCRDGRKIHEPTKRITSCKCITPDELKRLQELGEL